MSTAVTRLDVRPILASGADPFREIIAAATGVPEGGMLLLVAPFDPVPLREVLGANGFTSESAQTGVREWEVRFRRVAPTPPPAPDPAERLRFWAEGGSAHIDTRGLDEERALHLVLAAVTRVGVSEDLVAHLDANIDRLYPEILRLGWEAAFVPGDPGEVRLEISRLA